MTSQQHPARADTPSQRQVSRALLSIYLALFAAATGMSCVFAILPAAGRGLGLSETQLGWVVAPAALAFVLFGPVWGKLGQYLSAKAICTGSLLTMVVFNLLFGYTMSWRGEGIISLSACFAMLVFSRLMLSPFSAALLPTAQAYIARVTEGAARSRALAGMGASFALGLVASPGLAAVATSAGLLMPFYVVAVLLLVAAGACWLFLPSAAEMARHGADHPHAASHAAQHARTAWADIWQPLAVLVLLYVIYGILMQVTGFRMQDQFHLQATQATQYAGAALMATAATLVGAQMALSKISIPDPRVQRRLVLVGGLLGACGLGLLITDAGFALQLVGMGLFGLSLGTFLPFLLSLLTHRAQHAGDQARVGGLSGAAQGLGMMIGPLLGASSYRMSMHTPYWIATATIVLASVIYAQTSRVRG